MSWTNKTALVTGASGFLGSHLAEALVRVGARTRAMVHYNARCSAGWLDDAPLASDLEILPGDICDPDSVARAMRGVDVVFHLAALTTVPFSYQSPRMFVRTNVEGTVNLLEAAREVGVERFVMSSTSQTYGTALTVPIREDHPKQAQSPYAASKIAADKMCEAWFRTWGLPVVSLTTFCTYGPRQSVRNIVPTIITQLIDGPELRLGNLHPRRDYNYVTDAVEAFLLAATTPGVEGESFNIAGRSEISIHDLALRIGELMGREPHLLPDPERARPAGSEVERLLGDSAKAGERLGWTHRVELDEGLEKTIAWYRANAASVRPTHYQSFR